jgi:hypothetical protein
MMSLLVSRQRCDNRKSRPRFGMRLEICLDVQKTREVNRCNCECVCALEFGNRGQVVELEVECLWPGGIVSLRLLCEQPWWDESSRGHVSRIVFRQLP